MMRFKILVGLLFFWMVLGEVLAQSLDTTFIMVIKAPNGEEAVSINRIDSNRALFVANTGSFGSGGSDVYYGIVSINAQVDTSWTWGGVGQDIATNVEVVDSTVFISGYRNDFNSPDFRTFIRVCNLQGDEIFYSEGNQWTGQGSNVLFRIGDLVGYAELIDEEITFKWYDTFGIIQSNISIHLGPDVVIQDVSQQGSILLVSLINRQEELEAFTLFSFDTITLEQFQYTGPFQNNVGNGIILVNDSNSNYYTVYNEREDPDSNLRIRLESFTKDLNVTWSELYDKTEDDMVYDALINQSQDIVFFGNINSFGESGDFGIGFYDTNGIYIDLRTLGSSKLDIGKSIDTNDNGGYWMIGVTEGFNSQLKDLLIYYTNSAGITFSNDFIVYVESLPVITSTNNVVSSSGSWIFPNPYSNEAPLRFRPRQSEVEYSVLSSQGHEVSSKRDLEFTVSFLNSAPLGVYILVAYDELGKQTSVTKLIKI